MGHSKILHLVDYLLESIFLTTNWHHFCNHDQPCEVDSLRDDILTLSLEQFQLAALCLFFVIAMTWVRCSTCLSPKMQATGQTGLHKSAGMHKTHVLRLDSPTRLLTHSLSSKITQSLLPLLHKFDRFRVWPTRGKTTRATRIESIKKISSSRAFVTAVEISPRSDRRSSRAFVTAVELSPRSDRRSSRAFVTAVELSPRSDRRSSRAFVTAVKLSPLPDRRSSRAFVTAAELSPRPRYHCSQQLGRLDKDKSPSGNCQSETAFIGSLVKPCRDINGGLDSWVERCSNVRDCIDVCVEPHCDWKDGIDACVEPHCDCKDGTESRIEPHCDWKNGTDARVEPHSDCKNGIESRVNPHFDWKKSKEPIVKNSCNWEKGIEYLVEPTRGTKECGDSWFENRHYEPSEKFIANAPNSRLARSSRNTDTSHGTGVSRKKQSPTVEVKGYYPRKRMRLIQKQLPGDYCNVNSDEAVSDLLHGDLGSILNKYYKERCTGVSQLVPLRVRRKMAAPSSEHIKEEGFSVQTALTRKALNINITPNSTPEREKCLFTTTNCPSCQNTEIRNGKNQTGGILENSSQRKKRAKRRNTSNVGSKSSLLTLHPAENTVTVKTVIPPPQQIIAKKHEPSKTNHVNRPSTGRLQEKKQNDSDLEFVNCDQQSILSRQGQLLSGYSVISVTEGCAQSGTQKSDSSNNFQGHNLLSIFPSFSNEAVINSPPHTEEFLSSPGNYSGINDQVCAASSSKETLAEMTGSYSKPNQKYEDKRCSKPLVAITSVETAGRSGVRRSSAVSRDERDFVGRALAGAEMTEWPLAPNTDFTNSRIKCKVEGYSKIQSPRIRNFKESCRREEGSHMRTRTKSSAVKIDMCNSSHKFFTAQQTSIKQPLSRQLQDQKTDSVFKFGNVHLPQASNFVYGNRLIGREPLASMRQVLSKAAIMTSSSNYDTDKQSVLSQTDAISWSMTVQSRNSKLELREDAHIKAKKDGSDPTSDIHLQQGTHHTLTPEGWKESMFANSRKMLEYKKDSQQLHQDYLNSTGYQEHATGPQVQQSVGNESPVLNTRTFDGDVCVTEKATFDDATRVDAHPQPQGNNTAVPRQALLSNRSNAAITKDAYKRRSLIPRHINTLSKINRVKQDTTENVPCPANTLGTYPVNTMGTYPANTKATYPANTLGTYPANTLGTYPASTLATYPTNTRGSYPANTGGSYPANTLATYPTNTRGSYPANTRGSYPANTLATYPANTLGTYPASTLATYPTNTRGSYPANTGGSYPANTLATYPTNTRGSYPANTRGSYPANTLDTYPANTLGTYPASTLATYPTNTRGSYPANTGGSYHANTLDTYPANTKGTHPVSTMGTHPVSTMGIYLANTMGSDVHTMTTRMSKNSRYKNTFKSAATEQHPPGEMASDKLRPRTLVSETVKSGKQNPLEVIIVEKQSQLRQIRREKPCCPQTQAMIANTPTVPTSSTGRPYRWARSVVKHTQDQNKPAAKCSGKKELSSAIKNPGLATRDPKLYLVHTESKTRAKAKSGPTTSKKGCSQNKQSEANNEVKPTSIANKERGGFAGVNKGNEKEQNSHKLSKDSKEHNESDKEICTDEGADHAQAEAFDSNTASEEVSLLTMTTLNYRLMSNSPIHQRTNEEDVQKRSSYETDKGNPGNGFNCDILDNSTNEQITLGSKTEVLTNNAFKSLSGKRSRSERITQSEATSMHRTPTKCPLKSFKSATDNATGGSQTQQQVDLPDEIDSRGNKSLGSTRNTKCGNIQTPQGDATSTFNVQSTHDLPLCKCTFANSDQCCRIETSTDTNDVNNDTVKAVWSVKNIMSRTDSAYSTLTKTVASKQGFRSAGKENAGERCHTARPDLTATKAGRNHSRTLWSELDCNKSNTTGNITDQRRLNMWRICEVGDNGTGCRNAVKHKPTDSSMRCNKEERWFKPRCHQRCRLPCTVSTSNAIENPLFHLPSGICAARDNTHTLHVKSSHCSEVLPGTELPQIDEVTRVHSRSSLLPNYGTATSSEHAIPSHQRPILPFRTPHLNINDDTQHPQERTQTVRGITKETCVNQQTGNSCTKYKGIRNKFDVSNNDIKADPVVESRTGRTFKLSTRLYTKDNRLPTHGKYTQAKTLHGNGVNKVIEELAKQKYTQDRCKRLHARLKNAGTRKLALKQSGISEARIKHSLTKTTNIEQMKAENKYPNAIICDETGSAQTLPSENPCRQNNKTTSVKYSTHVCTNNTVDNRLLQHETTITGNNVSCQMRSQWLEVGRPVLSQNQGNGSKSGLKTGVEYAQLRRIQIEGNAHDFSNSQIREFASVKSTSRGNVIQIAGNANDFSNSQIREFASVKSTSRGNVILNEDGVEILSSTRQAAGSLIANNVNECDTTGVDSVTEHNGVTECNLASQIGHASASEEMPIHETEEMPVPESEEMPVHESEEMPVHGSKEMSVHEREEMPIHDTTVSLHNNISPRSKFSTRQKKRLCSGSVRSSRSMSSAGAGAGAATCVCSPVRSKLSWLKVNQPNYVAEIESQGTTGWRRTALVGRARTGIHASDIVEESGNNCETYHGNMHEQQLPNKQGHEEFTNATFCSEFNDKCVHKADQILNTDAIKLLPSRTELFVMPDYVSNASEDFACKTLSCCVRFNENERDNDKVMFYEHGPCYIQEVNDQCCSKVRCPVDQCCVTDVIMCPGCCSVGHTLRTDSKHGEQGTGFLQSLQTAVNTHVQEKSGNVGTLGGNQVTASKSKLLFPFNRSWDCTNTDTDSDDSSSLWSTMKENSSNKHLAPMESESVNYWSRDSKSTYPYASSQESECTSHHKYSDNYDYNSMNRFARKHDSKSHYHLTKEGKYNSKCQLLTNSESTSHKKGPRLINSRSLKLLRSQSSPDASTLKIISPENRKRTYLHQNEQSASVSMYVDTKGAIQSTALIQGDIDRQSALACLWALDGCASPRLQNVASNDVTYLPANLGQQLHGDDTHIQRQEFSLQER